MAAVVTRMWSVIINKRRDATITRLFPASSVQMTEVRKKSVHHLQFNRLKHIWIQTLLLRRITFTSLSGICLSCCPCQEERGQTVVSCCLFFTLYKMGKVTAAYHRWTFAVFSQWYYGFKVKLRHSITVFHSSSWFRNACLHNTLELISQILVLAYFNRHGAQGKGWRRKMGCEGRNEKHKVREREKERETHFFLSHHVLLYNIHFLCDSSASLRHFVFLLHHCQCALAEVVQVATSPLDPVSMLDPSLPKRFPKLWTVQSAAVVTWEYSVVVLSCQSPLKTNMFDFSAQLLWLK